MERPLTKNIRPGQEPLSLNEYEHAGGYQAVRKALTMSPRDVQNIVKASNLRGRGGAGFSTGMKWSFVPMGDAAPRPKYLIVNADEMEPGTFKDRLLLEGDPHQIIEGIITSAYAIEAQQAFIFIRWAYKQAVKRLDKAISEAYAKKYLGKNIFGSGYNLDLRIHGSAGRYICGEETALLNALEGRRATPRAKPPFPQVCGLFGKPTIVNNVETIANIPHIINNGPDWFKSLSTSDDTGTKLYGVSGRVRKPRAWELPMGVTIRELIEEHAGGMQDGYQFRGVIPGGASTDFLVPKHLDVKMDFDSIMKAGSRLGTGNNDRARRQDLPGRVRSQPDEVLCPRVLRLVHALPGWSALARKNIGFARRRHAVNRVISRISNATAHCLARAIRSVLLRPAPSNRSRARSNISVRILRGIYEKRNARGKRLRQDYRIDGINRIDRPTSD